MPTKLRVILANKLYSEVEVLLTTIYCTGQFPQPQMKNDLFPKVKWTTLRVLL